MECTCLQAYSVLKLDVTALTVLEIPNNPPALKINNNFITKQNIGAVY